MDRGDTLEAVINRLWFEVENGQYESLDIVKSKGGYRVTVLEYDNADCDVSLSFWDESLWGALRQTLAALEKAERGLWG